MSPPSDFYRTIEKICDDTWKPLYQYIYYKVQNQEEAEDIVQETYVRAIPYIQKGKIVPKEWSGIIRLERNSFLTS